MAPLTSAKRHALPTSAFALPGRRYPVPDRSHARNALARVSQHGTPQEKARVRATVHRRFPTIGHHHSDHVPSVTHTQAPGAHGTTYRGGSAHDSHGSCRYR